MTREPSTEARELLDRIERLNRRGGLGYEPHDVLDRVADYIRRASTPPATVPDDVVERARRNVASRIEGDSDNPLRVAAANEVYDGRRDDSPEMRAEIVALSAASLKVPADLVELSEKATPGPWWRCDDDSGDRPVVVPSIQAPEEIDCAIVHWDGFWQEYWQSARGHREILANADLIIAAVNFVRSLIDQQQKGEG